MRRGEFEEVWGPTEGDEESEEEIEAWVEIRGAGRATVSIQGFHHFLKPEIFRGDPTNSILTFVSVTLCF